MNHLIEWIVNPIYKIMNYPISIFGFTVDIKSILIFMILIDVVILIITMIFGGND